MTEYPYNVCEWEGCTDTEAQGRCDRCGCYAPDAVDAYRASVDEWWAELYPLESDGTDDA